MEPAPGRPSPTSLWPSLLQVGATCLLPGLPSCAGYMGAWGASAVHVGGLAGEHVSGSWVCACRGAAHRAHPCCGPACIGELEPRRGWDPSPGLEGRRARLSSTPSHQLQEVRPGSPKPLLEVVGASVCTPGLPTCPANLPCPPWCQGSSLAHAWQLGSQCGGMGHLRPMEGPFWGLHWCSRGAWLSQPGLQVRVLENSWLCAYRHHLALLKVEEGDTAWASMRISELALGQCGGAPSAGPTPHTGFQGQGHRLASCRAQVSSRVHPWTDTSQECGDHHLFGRGLCAQNLEGSSPPAWHLHTWGHAASSPEDPSPDWLRLRCSHSASPSGCHPAFWSGSLCPSASARPRVSWHAAIWELCQTAPQPVPPTPLGTGTGAGTG